MRASAALVVCVTASACGFNIGVTASDASDPDARIDGAVIDAAIDAPMTTCADSWYGAAWSTRRKITVDAAVVTGSPTQMPVLVDVLATAAQANGNDFVFTLSDGVTRAPHEIDRYEPAASRLIAWVQVPMLSSGATTQLYLYYGNPAAPNQQNAAGVWSPDYHSVWHLGDNPSGPTPQIKDSAIAAKHATVTGGLNQNSMVQGKIAGGIVFDGSNDGLDVATFPIAGTFSYEAWIYPTTNTNWHCVINNYPAWNRWFGVYNLEADFYDGGSEYRRAANLVNGTWHHVAATYDGVELKLYRDGVQRGPAQALSLPAVTSGLQIGYTETLSEWFTGRLDEIRVSRGARSAAYIATAFANQTSPAAFLPTDLPETCP